MDKKTQNYLTTGEFARVVGVSKETLFHYDETGVFCPEIRAENDYRYYSVFQIEAFEVICVLKELGMPLKEIKAYLDNRNPEALIELLDEQSSRIAHKIEALNKMNNFITKKAKLTRSALKTNLDEIVVLSMPKELLITTSLEDVKTERDFMLKVAEHFKLCERYNILSPYAMGEILPLKNAGKGSSSEYTCYYTRTGKAPNGVTPHTKPAGNYLIAHHKGGYITADLTYKRILSYAKEHNLTLGENFYEDVIYDELSVKGYEAYVLRMSILVV